MHSEQLILALDEDAAGLRIPLDKGISGTVITTGKAVRIADAYSDERFDQEADAITGYVTRNILAVPVVRRGSEPPHAAERGDVEQLQAALRATPAAKNAKNRYGRTALMEAARKGHLAVVEALLAAGADVHERNKFGQTAADWALEHSHLTVYARL